MLQSTPNGKHTAQCDKTGAYLDASRKQWTLVYEQGQVYETRHWQRAKVAASAILEKAQASLDRIILAQLIHDAVWSRQIDQISTHEVANRFGCSLATARTILMNIRNGTSGDSRFRLDKERDGGVLISDGSTFDYSPMDLDGNGSSVKSVKHYIWFCS